MELTRKGMKEGDKAFEKMGGLELADLKLPKLNFTLDGAKVEQLMNISEIFSQLEKSMLNITKNNFGNIFKMVEYGDLDLNKTLDFLQRDIPCNGFNNLAMEKEDFDELPKDGDGVEFLKNFQDTMKRKAAIDKTQVDSDVV